MQLATSRRARFGEIVFEHDEDFPLIPVRIADPGLILDRIAAVRLHFIPWNQPFIGPSHPYGQDIIRGRDLNPEMGERPALVERDLIERQVELRAFRVELCIVGPDFGGLNAEEFS